MRFQDQAVRMTHRALDDIVRSARAVPQDRLDWVPMGFSRSVLSQMREIAAAGRWFLPILRDREAPEFDSHAAREAARIRRGFKTLDQCVDAARANTSALCEAIEELADEHLDDELHLPFGGGVTLSLADVAMLHHNNMVYHLGQINQLQLMLGDREMH